MGENKITRDVYKHYANRIVSVLKDEDFYQQFKKRVDKGSASFKLAKKRLIQDISIDWIDTIESVLPNLDTIVRNPRKFIVQEEDIVDVSLARSISTESVKFLAQHTNMISKVDKNGDVTPSKILNITKEESFEIYENRFIYTLLLKLKDFVTMRYDKIKKASATQDVLELDVESRFNLPSKKITFRTEYFAQLSFDEVMRLDPDTLTKIERVAKIDRIITDFLSSSFAKSMRNSAPVRPPIMRTNVILKEPNFKKALTLWQFIETYQQTGGFSTSDEVEDIPLDDNDHSRLREMVTLNTMIFESMYDECETDFDMEDKEFADFMRVGAMDFQKDELQRDEYAQKLEDEIENEEEQDNVQEVKPQEEENADKEIPPETPSEEEQPQDKQPDSLHKDKEPEILEKEIEKEVVVERPVEVERFREMAPKADQEEVDLEPDAEKFDQHLFEVRKIFKRPDGDKLKQEEIIKVRDAIDRCLTSYRRIKQEEIDEKERQERIRRRKEDIEKRAAAFRKQREELEKSGVSDDSSVYFGMDPFSYQKAKIAEERRQEEAEKARKEALKLARNEQNLELEDKNTEEINKSIEEMEKDKAERALKNEQIDKKLDSIDAILPSLETPQETASTDDSQQEPVEEAPEQLEESGVEEPVEELNEPVVNAPQGEIEQEPTQVDERTPQDVAPQQEPVTEPVEQPVEEVEPQEAVEETVEEQSTEPDEERVPREKRNPWDLSPTTLNQKYSTPSGRKRNLEAVDESKVAVGGIRFADGSGIDDPFGSFGITANKAETGRIAPEKPSEEEPTPVKKPRKKREPKPVTPAESENSAEKQADNTDAQKEDNVAQEPATPPVDEVKKPKPKKDANGLSPTTLNQKYSTPSGKKRNLEAVDESKVAVGGITFKDGSGIDNPFGSLGITANKAENYDADENE